MAEKLKEFVNTTLTETDFTNNEYTILTNASSTQSVIKDIHATATSKGAVDANIEIFNGIATVATGGVSTGFELVEADSSLKLRMNPAMDGGSFKTYVVMTPKSTNTIWEHSLQIPVDSTYPLKASTSYVEAFTTDDAYLSMGSSMNQPSWIFINKEGTKAMYQSYDGNSTTQLFTVNWGVSGPVGSWSAIQNNSYQYRTLDTESGKSYWQYNTDGVRSYDIATGVTDTYSTALSGVSGGSTNNSTYNRSAFVNGVFFVQPSNSYSTRILYYDTVSKVNGQIAGSFLSGGNGALGVTWNPDEKCYYILTKSSTSSALVYFEASGSLSGDYTAILIEENITTFASDSGYIGSDMLGHFATTNSSAQTEISKPTKTGNVILFATTSENNYSRAGPAIVKGNTGVAIPSTEVEVKLNLKVSGVEITGV